MQHLFDPLIAERAPWLFNRGASMPRKALMRLLSYSRTLELAEKMKPLSAQDIMASMGALLARDIQATGLENIPHHGAALIVANHPTGIADGIILSHILSQIRPDHYLYANRDILRILPQMDRMIAPVEWRIEQRSHAKTKATLDFTRAAVDEGRLGVIFPSGRLAKRRGLRLHERPWMASAAMIARKFQLPVIPVNIQARNSALFYLFDLIHPTLRDITLFHETLNKDRQPFRITVGEPVAPGALPAKSEEGIALLRRATLALGGRHAPTVSLIDSSRRYVWP